MSDSYLLFRKRLVAKRKKLGLTLQALADRANVSKSIISKIENAQVQPTIETASHIAGGLNSSLSEMFLEEQLGAVIHHSVNEQLVLDQSEHFRRIMSPSLQRSCVEIFYEHLTSEDYINGGIYSDAEKFIVVLEGELTVNTNGTQYLVKSGDCMHIESKVEYSLKNTYANPVKFMTIVHRLHLD